MDCKTIGRYEILEEIGRGGMGSVLRAHDPAVGRMVAIKFIHAASLVGDQAAEYRQRFYREARAAGALSHPGIVPVFDVGEQDGSPYLVMELVQGRTLESVLKDDERYPFDRVCQIGQQIADALGFAHHHGIIHRDIKPANILLTSREVYGAERPRITDFGVAKLVGGEMTSTGQLLGTPAFMAPEQFTGAHIDGRADLFSLGVVLYRMTTGELPFGGETITAISYKIVHADPIPPSILNPAVPPEMEAVILKSLAKNPSLRYQSGEELAADLEAVRTRMPGADTRAIFPPSAVVLNSGTAQTIGQMALQPAGDAADATMQSSPPTATQILGQGAPSAPATQAPPTATPPSAATQSAAIAPPAPVVAPSVVSAAQAPPPQPAASAVSMSRAMTRGVAVLAFVVVVVVVAVLGIKFFLARRAPQTAQQPFTPQTAAGAQPPAASQPPAATSVQPATPTAAAAPTPAPPAAGPTPSPSSPAVKPANTKANQQLVPAKAPVSAAAGASSIISMPIDPETSARVRIALDGFTAFFKLTLQVDGKVYWNGSAGDPQLNEGLLVPAGKHDLCILVTGQGVVKTSNTVNGDLAAKKRATILAKLRPEAAGGSATLDPSAQVTIVLKRNLFGL